MSDPAVEALADALSSRYLVERELGRGGMATVYLARDLRHEREVALKLLRPELGAVLGAERFLREIRLTAKLQHPHILPLLDSGETSGRFYYVMPYVEGESLRDRLKREGQLPVHEALRLTREVAEALDYAHQEGIIHRDIKPENILLSRGHALIADFGIALAVTQAGGGRLTETGLSLGTPAYMSPEQAMAEPRLDGRSDQYSLACMLYEMLAGEPPYTGPTAQAIIAKRLSEPVPHVGTLREVPPAVEIAVTRALAKAPADRFLSVLNFVTAFETSYPRPGIKRRSAALLLSGLAIVVLAALAARSLAHRTPRSPSHRQLTFTGQASAPALSPDHHWLAYASDNNLLVQDLLSAAPPISITAAPRLMTVRWSPDGARLFYLAADSTGWAVHTIPRDGGAPHRLGTSYLYDLSSAGDTIYASLGSDSVTVFDAKTGARDGGFSLQPLANTIYSLAVSPDGRWLAFVGVKGSITSLGLCRTDGSQARRLVEGVPRASSLGWSRSSDAIYYLRDLGNGANNSAAGDVMRLGIARSNGKPRGEPRVVLGGAFVQEFFLSADAGQLAYTKAPPQQKIWAMTFTGPASHPSVQARELTTGTTIFGTPDISPDGRWVAFARNDGGVGNLYITPFELYEPRPLVATPADEWSPRWSPSGREIAYAVRDAQSPGIHVADVASGRVRRIASDGLAPLGVISWMPLGREVVFPLDLGQHYAIADVISGHVDTLVAPDSVGFHLTVPAPDGHNLAVNVNLRLHSPYYGLWVVERSGKPWKVLDPGGHHLWISPLLWTTDGWIYFLTSEAELYRVRADGGAAVRIANLPQPCSRWQTALSMSARQLVCTVSNNEPDIWIAENFDPEEN